MTHPFPPEVVDAVVRHMNEDHAEDSLLICQALGGVSEATAAHMTGLDTAAFLFAATVDGADVEVAVATVPLTERAHIRAEAVRLYRSACATAGVEPRPSAEHGPPNHPSPQQGISQ